MLSCCYILITNIRVFGKWGVKALVLMQETDGTVGPVPPAPGCRCIVNSSWCCTTRSPAARSLPAMRYPPSRPSATSSGCPALRCAGPSPILPSRATSNVGKESDRSSVNAVRSDEVPSAGSYMDGLRQTQFQTSIMVVEHDIRTPPSWIGDALGGDRRDAAHFAGAQRA